MDIGSLGMTEHRYAVGDLVRVRTDVIVQPVQGSLKRPDGNSTKSIYEISRLLPELVSGEPQYEIINCADGATYVIRESQLVALPSPPPQPRR
jgi:hypothetical protein